MIEIKLKVNGNHVQCGNYTIVKDYELWVIYNGNENIFWDGGSLEQAITYCMENKNDPTTD